MYLRLCEDINEKFDLHCHECYGPHVEAAPRALAALEMKWSGKLERALMAVMPRDYLRLAEIVSLTTSLHQHHTHWSSPGQQEDKSARAANVACQFKVAVRKGPGVTE